MHALGSCSACQRWDPTIEAAERRTVRSRALAPPALRSLLVSHIPFLRSGEGDVTLDDLPACRLEGLCCAIGPLRVIASELSSGTSLASWGPTLTTISSQGPLSFGGLPTVASGRHGWKRPRLRTLLNIDLPLLILGRDYYRWMAPGLPAPVFT